MQDTRSDVTASPGPAYEPEAAFDPVPGPDTRPGQAPDPGTAALAAARRGTSEPGPAGPECAVVVPCYNERANVAVLVSRVAIALAGLRWEVVFVDDNSPDGTAAEVRRIAALDPRVRCLRRVGRRGLSSAVIEGAMSTTATFVAVMDGDLQHDETRLPEMFRLLREGDTDLVVGSRHVEGGDASGLSSHWRHKLSQNGTRMAQALLPIRLSDPMSGFFALRRDTFETLVPKLNGSGFKILLDLVLAASPPPRVTEVAFRFRERETGESKMNVLVLAQFAGMLLDKALHGLVPMRFVAFMLVGAIGVLVNLAVLVSGVRLGLQFGAAEILATIVAMVANFQLNNGLTYRGIRLRGPGYWRGLLLFMVVCSLGALANVGIATSMYSGHSGLLLSSAAGAVVGVVWNYAVSSTLVWGRARP